MISHDCNFICIRTINAEKFKVVGKHLYMYSTATPSYVGRQECVSHEEARFLRTDCKFSTRNPSLVDLWLRRSSVMTAPT